MGGAILFLMLLLLLISAMYSMTVMFLSEWLKKSAGVMAVPFGIMIFTLFIDIPYSYGTVSKVYELLPTNLLMTWELWDDRLLSVLGNYMYWEDAGRAHIGKRKLSDLVRRRFTGRML